MNLGGSPVRVYSPTRFLPQLQGVTYPAARGASGCAEGDFTPDRAAAEDPRAVVAPSAVGLGDPSAVGPPVRRVHPASGGSHPDYRARGQDSWP